MIELLLQLWIWVSIAFALGLVIGFVVAWRVAPSRTTVTGYIPSYGPVPVGEDGGGRHHQPAEA